MAGVAVSGRDILARQRSRTVAGLVCFEASAMPTLRWNAAPDRDHRWQRPSARQSRAAITGAGQSRHKFSGQRMMRLNEHDIAEQMTIFETRIKPCRIAVRADHEKCEQFDKHRRRNCGSSTAFGDGQSGIQSVVAITWRLTEHCQLKTDDSQRRCGMRFPSGTCRCKSTGLLEQMP